MTDLGPDPIATTPRLRAWAHALADPVTPGMDSRSLRARPAALGVMLAFVAAQAVLRYELPALQRSYWQALHLVIGYAFCLGVVVAFHGPGALARVRRSTWVVLGAGMLFLCGFWYLGRMDAYGRFWAPLVGREGAYAPVYAFMYFAVCATLFRLVAPLVTARLLLGRTPADLGLFAPRNAHPPAVRRIWPVYLLLYLVVMPFVLHAAGTAGFQAKYPMCRAMIAGGGIRLDHFLVYEAFYVLIFVSGESFWRGFLSFGAERDFGLYALALMVVPYVASHYGKPLPETLGAIAAGMTLGWLALKHRSVWLGVALHYAIALSMDLLAIWTNGFVIHL